MAFNFLFPWIKFIKFYIRCKIISCKLSFKVDKHKNTYSATTANEKNIAKYE